MKAPLWLRDAGTAIAGFFLLLALFDGSCGRSTAEDFGTGVLPDDARRLRSHRAVGSALLGLS